MMHQKLALGFVLVGLVCRVAAAASAEPSIWLRMSPDSTCENIAEAMGRYRLNGTANGYPRFQLASVDVVRFLCRTHALSTKPGLWSVTGSEANIEKLKGTIVPIIAVESPVGQKYMAHCASDKQWDVDDTFLVLDVSYEGAKADQEATEANKAEQEAPAKEARADADVFASAPKAEQETEDAEARVSTARGLEVCECASGQTLGDDEAGSNVSTHSNSAGWVPTLQQLGITLFGLAMVVVCFTVVPAIWMQPMQPMQISSEVPDEDLMNVLHDVEKKLMTPVRRYFKDPKKLESLIKEEMRKLVEQQQQEQQKWDSFPIWMYGPAAFLCSYVNFPRLQNIVASLAWISWFTEQIISAAAFAGISNPLKVAYYLVLALMTFNGYMYTLRQPFYTLPSWKKCVYWALGGSIGYAWAMLLDFDFF